MEATKTKQSLRSPGNWTASNANGKACWTVYADGITVCDINTSCPEPGECEANARLIAAAPALLDALRELVKQTGTLPGSLHEDRPDHVQAWELGQAALRLADGD